jgi:hypothetical protein
MLYPGKLVCQLLASQSGQTTLAGLAKFPVKVPPGTLTQLSYPDKTNFYIMNNLLVIACDPPPADMLYPGKLVCQLLASQSGQTTLAGLAKFPVKVPPGTLFQLTVPALLLNNNSFFFPFQ